MFRSDKDEMKFLLILRFKNRKCPTSFSWGISLYLLPEESQADIWLYNPPIP
jgi:hypothetical protein